MDIEALKTELDEYGFVVLPDLIPAPDARHMAKRLMEIMDQIPDSHDFSGANETSQHLRGVFNFLHPSEFDLFEQIVINPVLLELADYKLGDGFQLNTVAALWRKPGAAIGKLHADLPMLTRRETPFPTPKVCFLLNCLWMLSDFTKENGATRVMPFSHHAGIAPRAEVDYRHLVSIEGRAGSVVVLNGPVWHAAWSNTTKDDQRIGAPVPYHARWMDPTDPALGWCLHKRSVRDKFSPMMQELTQHVEDD